MDYYTSNGKEGSVVEFDFQSGLGKVADDGGGQWPFHCTAVRDGSRNIEVNKIVRFSLRPGWAGRWEATDLLQLS